jgi:hypothetical protein
MDPFLEASARTAAELLAKRKRSGRRGVRGGGCNRRGRTLVSFILVRKVILGIVERANEIEIMVAVAISTEVLYDLLCVRVKPEGPA